MSKLTVLVVVFIGAVLAAGCVVPPDPPADPWDAVEGLCLDSPDDGFGAVDATYVGPPDTPGNFAMFDSFDGTCTDPQGDGPTASC